MKRVTVKGKFKAEFQALRNAIDRCTRSSHPQYGDYGGRGLTVSEDFTCPVTGFVTFLAEVGRKPYPTWTLERKCNDTGYVAGNLIWATRSANQQNRRPNKAKAKDLGWGVGYVWTERKDGHLQRYPSALLEHDGRIQTIKAWADETGLTTRVITSRFNRGWTMEEVLSPVLLNPWRNPRQNQTIH